MAKQYRALVDLWLPADKAEEKRILKARESGEKLTDRQMVRVRAGEIAEFIPETSLKWLLAEGRIEEVKSGSEG